MNYFYKQFQRLGTIYRELVGVTVGKTQVHKWIRNVGETFDDTATKKCYYTDRHEDADNVHDRVLRYILELYRQQCEKLCGQHDHSKMLVTRPLLMPS